MLNANIEAIAVENHLDAAALIAFVEYEDIAPDDVVEAFQEAYAGTFSSVEAWAENILEDTGMLESVPENLRAYFDFEAWARDCELNGEIWTSETVEGIAVFWRR